MSFPGMTDDFMKMVRVARHKEGVFTEYWLGRLRVDSIAKYTPLCTVSEI
jgi:hypothetical protein